MSSQSKKRPTLGRPARTRSVKDENSSDDAGRGQSQSQGVSSSQRSTRSRGKPVNGEDSAGNNNNSSDDGRPGQSQGASSSQRSMRSRGGGRGASSEEEVGASSQRQSQQTRHTKPSSSSQGRRTPAPLQRRRRAVESNSAEAHTESSDDGRARGSQKQKSNKASARKEAANSIQAAERASKAERRARVQNMINQGVLYIIMANAKKLPIKRADFIRVVCEGEKNRNLARKVLSKVQDIVDKVFGIDIYALNETTLEYDTDVLVQGRSSFMLVSQFQTLALVKGIGRQDEREEALRASLFICLNLIFMQNMENGIPEPQLWAALSRLGFTEQLKVYEKDFGRFMKTEYVSTFYLATEDTKDEFTGTINSRYLWGPRAHLEFRKLGVFMYALMTCNLRASDFPRQVQMIMDSDEAEEASDVIADWEKNFEGLEAGGSDESSDDDASAILSSAGSDDEMSAMEEGPSAETENDTDFENQDEDAGPEQRRSRRTAQVSDSEVSNLNQDSEVDEMSVADETEEEEE